MPPTWDAFQLVLAVARGRTLAAAGRSLGVDPSTVFRRLGALERELDASLFERLPGGYAPTALGASLLATAERMEQAAAGLEGQLAGATLRLDGQVGPPQAGALDLRVWLAGENLQAAAAAFGAAGLPAGPFEVEALVQQQGPQTLSLPVLKGTLDGTDFDATLLVDTAGERPRLTGDLHVGRIELPARDSAGDEQAGSGGLIPDVPLPVAPLTLADATLAVTLDELVFGERRMTDLVASLALEGGRLQLDPFSFGYRDGKVEGALTYDVSREPAAMALTLNARGLDLAEATGDAVTGRFAVDLDLAGTGASPKALASTLSGRSAFSSGDGRIDSQLLAVASAPLAGVLGPLFGGDGEVALTCIVSRFSWNDGIGTSQGTAIDAATFSVIGNGTVNLRNETIDFYVDTWTKDTALIGVAVPVTVSGPLAAPTIAPDPAGTALGLAKTAGLIVFPPAGLAAIIEDRVSAQSANACVAAVEQVEEGGGPASFFQSLGAGVGEAVGDAIEGAGDAAGEAGDAIEKGLEDATESIKSLFGN